VPRTICTIYTGSRDPNLTSTIAESYDLIPMGREAYSIEHPRDGKTA